MAVQEAEQTGAGTDMHSIVLHRAMLSNVSYLVSSCLQLVASIARNLRYFDWTTHITSARA